MTGMKNGQADGMEKLRRTMEKKLTAALLNNKGMGGDEGLAVSHKKVEMCLACNRPIGKSVSINSSTAHAGPVFDPTRQLLGRRPSEASNPSMLLRLEKDEQRRRSTVRNTALLPKGLPKGAYAGGFQMPVKKGVWSEDLGRAVGTAGFAEGEGEESRERQVRKTLRGLHIDPDSPGGRESILGKARRESQAGGAGQRVGKSWMTVSSKGLTVQAGGEAPESGAGGGAGGGGGGGGKQRSRTLQGKSLSAARSPKGGSQKGLMSPVNGGKKGGELGGDFSLPAVGIGKG